MDTARTTLVIISHTIAKLASSKIHSSAPVAKEAFVLAVVVSVALLLAAEVFCEVVVKLQNVEKNDNRNDH